MSTTYQQVVIADRANKLKEKCAKVGILATDIKPGELKVESALTPQAVENQLIQIDPALRINLESKGMGTEGIITFADVEVLNE